MGKQLRSRSVRVKKSFDSPFKTSERRSAELEEKRWAVLAAAAELFVTRGFHRTKLADVAERLQITKPAIYYYFKSKDEILVGCIRAALEAAEHYFQETDDPSLPGRTRLERFMVWFGASMTQPFGRCLVRVAEHDVDEATQAQLVAAKRKIYLHIRRLVEAGGADGSLRRCEPGVAALTLAGGLGWMSHWYRAEGPWSASQSAEYVTDLLLMGLTPA